MARSMTGCMVLPMKNPTMNAMNMTMYVFLSRFVKSNLSSRTSDGGGGGGGDM